MSVLFECRMCLHVCFSNCMWAPAHCGHLTWRHPALPRTVKPVYSSCCLRHSQIFIVVTPLSPYFCTNPPHPPNYSGEEIVVPRWLVYKTRFLCVTVALWQCRTTIALFLVHIFPWRRYSHVPSCWWSLLIGQCSIRECLFHFVFLVKFKSSICMHTKAVHLCQYHPSTTGCVEVGSWMSAYMISAIN